MSLPVSSHTLARFLLAARRGPRSHARALARPVFPSRLGHPRARAAAPRLSALDLSAARSRRAALFQFLLAVAAGTACQLRQLHAGVHLRRAQLGHSPLADAGTRSSVSCLRDWIRRE